MSLPTNAEPRVRKEARLPLSGLLALFTAGFLGIINETIPAGLLPTMSNSLGLSEAAAGQTVTVYALATAFTAIPINSALKNLDRRIVLVAALVTFALANAVVALVSSFMVILVARFVAGVGAGLIWSNLGGYAARIAPAALQGKAIAIAMAGTPIALSLGLPLGTFLGDEAGWQATFAVAAAISVALIVWVLVSLPSLPGQAEKDHVRFVTILRAPGVRPILGVVAGFMVAHSILYTYIAPLAIAAHAGGQVEWVLVVFGAAALLSIWATGSYVDPHHRRLVVMSMVVLGGGAFVLGFAVLSPVIFYLGVAAWGFGFGGSATLFVTAGIRAAGTDGVQSMLVTVFNLSIAAGGVFGGLLLSGLGVTSIPWTAVAIMIPTAIATIAGRRHAFPHWPKSA
ncbi:putative MFS family arabinose efflux permease [Kribbella aluminosa]|uniref:MFS family arabinose efflux permease n=1 Tax=Kribbella aluminosa TaxID=416017 RepID=A0ABS4UVN3_9ACTN|nr:MFS transporter [Kribbella aluminosa]MBP2355688.1 putative MFS family arabinose efflux permease [Kribbella aluminosa]